MTRRLYTRPAIDVSFDGEICQHAAECVRGVPEVSTPRPARESTPGWPAPTLTRGPAREWR